MCVCVEVGEEGVVQAGVERSLCGELGAKLQLRIGVWALDPEYSPLREIQICGGSTADDTASWSD